MGLFSRESTISDVTTEHSIVIRVSPPPGPSGTATDMASIAVLEEELIAAITQGRAGEFDGSEFIENDVYFYAYGPNADQLFAAIRPILLDFPAHCHVVLRYGSYHDSQARTTVVQL
jgi:hypothetical protein